VRFCLKWAEKNSAVRKFLSLFGLRLNILVSFLLLLSYLAPFVPPDAFWPLAFMGLAYPYFLLVNLIFLLIWVLLRSKNLLLPLFVLGFGFNYFANTFRLIPHFKSKDAGITLLSYNVHSIRAEQKGHRLNNPGIIEYFKSVGADIICLQEGIHFKDGKLSPKGLADALPGINYFHVVSSGNYSDLVTFSRYPILNKGEIRFSDSEILVLFSDIKIANNRMIRVYNCHLQSYSIDPDDYTVIDSLASGINDRQIGIAKKVSFKLKNGFILRSIQVRKLAEHIRKSPYPVVVCGDFNDTPVSYAYRKVRGELNDAFVESGWWNSNTYNGQLPSFRIDYILADKRFTLEDYSRDRVLFSDHFPVHSKLIFQ